MMRESLCELHTHREDPKDGGQAVLEDPRYVGRIKAPHAVQDEGMGVGLGEGGRLRGRRPIEPLTC
jgi:hypothetical protein